MPMAAPPVARMEAAISLSTVPEKTMIDMRSSIVLLLVKYLRFPACSDRDSASYNIPAPLHERHEVCSLRSESSGSGFRVYRLNNTIGMGQMSDLAKHRSGSA